MERCRWADGDPLLEKYHDTEWGMPLFDDRLHFEALSLEVMQCGLSWMTVLRKREALRAAFSDFDLPKIYSFIFKNRPTKSIHPHKNISEPQIFIRGSLLFCLLNFFFPDLAFKNFF